MIQTVETAQQHAHFLAAAQAHLATNAQLSARLALFGALPGSRWQFYTSDEVNPLAIALRGGVVTVAGQYDPEELGSFCSFLGVECITTPSTEPPLGYELKQTLHVYTMWADASGDKQLPLPDVTGQFAGQQGNLVLEQEPSVSAIVPLLFAGEPPEVQDQYYADSCIARSHGMAEFWLLQYQNKPIFTLAASSIVGQEVYLSAGETLEAYRGQGIGGHYIVKMANEYAAQGYRVCFVCEQNRCHFYNRLGFTKVEELYQYWFCE